MKLFKLITIFTLLGLLSLNAKSLRIEISELKDNLDTYKVIDTRDNTSYLQSHIKTAINLPIKLSYLNQKLNGRVVQPVQAQEIFRNLGLKKDDNIVIYDDGSFFDAARLFWTLEVYSFKNVKLLNGGFNQWKENNFKISKDIPNIKKSNYIVSVDNKRLATKFTTQIATKNPNQIILDARDEIDYIGKVSSAKRYGHIKNALHYPASHNISYSKNITKLQSNDHLKKLYSNVSKDKKIIVYCKIGRVSSSNYFALRELGYNVSNYDSSWHEWGNDEALPISNPSKEI